LLINIVYFGRVIATILPISASISAYSCLFVPIPAYSCLCRFYILSTSFILGVPRVNRSRRLFAMGGAEAGVALSI